MHEILNFVHQLEKIQTEMRIRSFFGAARSLEETIVFLRHEYDLAVLKYENSYERRVN